MREPLHLVLRELVRSYSTLKTSNIKDWNNSVCRIKGCANVYSGEEGPMIRKGHDGPCDLVHINLMDLQGCLKNLSKRKKEAVFYNVICDMKQKDAAAIMGITTVSVGQYVEQSMLQMAKELWPDEENI